ncbi:MAG: hypothetical protein OXI96_06115, partial [Acidimicrobiaceae bacterium]|nr:hypothetical protein [Acidimicrobiaceae bacterium]
VVCANPGFDTKTQIVAFTVDGSANLSGLDDTTRTGVGSIIDWFDITPSGTTCSAQHISGIPAGITLSDNTGTRRSLQATTTTTGSLRIRVVCGNPNYDAVSQTVTFTAVSAVQGCAVLLGSLGVDTVTQTGQWSTGTCRSSQRGSEQSPHYAKRYEFTLDSAANVTVDLTSTQDAYLYLLSGHGTSGTVSGENDDVDTTSDDSRVSVELAAGDYTIEATTNAANVTGGFTLTVNANCPTGQTRQTDGTCSTASPPECETALDITSEDPLSGELTANGDCESQQRTASSRTYHAKRYTFTFEAPSWMTIDLKSAANQMPALDTYLLLLSGHGAGGGILERDDDGGANTDSRLPNLFLPAGDYTIEVTSYHANTEGSFNLTVQTQSQTEAAGPVEVAGIPQSIWTSVGGSLELPFTFGHLSEPAPGEDPVWSAPWDPYVYSVASVDERTVVPTYPPEPPRAANWLNFWIQPYPYVTVSHVEGSGRISVRSARTGDFRVVLGFRSDDPTLSGVDATVGLYAFFVRVCSAGQLVKVGASTSCAVDASGVPTIYKNPPSDSSDESRKTVPVACVERASAGRWFTTGDRQWPDTTSASAPENCSLLGDTNNRPARYFAFEVPFERAEVTIRLASEQDTHLILLGPVQNGEVSIDSELDSNNDGYAGYENSDSTNSRIDRWDNCESDDDDSDGCDLRLSRGMYVVVATVPAPELPTATVSVSGDFTLNIKILLPPEFCAGSTSTSTSSIHASSSGIVGGVGGGFGFNGSVGALVNTTKLKLKEAAWPTCLLNLKV